MNQSALDPAGLRALHTASLWWILFWVCTAVFAITAVALAYALWRRRPADAPPIEPAPRGDDSVWRFLFGAVAVIVVTLLGLLVADFFTARKVLETGAPADPNALTVQIRGHQWWWEIRYPDAMNPSLLVTTANEIHVPVGRTVQVILDSQDVIHSFWVPSLSGKKDMIPGSPTSTWLRADRAGVFRGQCAEFCGLQHAHMDLYVVAEPAEKFAAWMDAQRGSAPSPRTASQQLGREILTQKSCVLCHRIQGEPNAQATVGPDLTHLASRAVIAAALPNTRENLGQWILDPSRTKPGVLMPPTALKAEELNALLDYLATLR